MNRLARAVMVSTIAMVSIMRCGGAPIPPEEVKPHIISKSLYVDSTFLEKENKCILDSAREWSRVTKGMVSITVYHAKDMVLSRGLRPTHDDILVQRLSNGSVQVAFLDNMLSAFVYGYYDKSKVYSQLFLVPDRFSSAAMCKKVTMHELGHSLGLHHTSKVGTLMYFSVDMSVDIITHDDMIQFCEIYNCDSSQF